MRVWMWRGRNYIVKCGGSHYERARTRCNPYEYRFIMERAVVACATSPPRANSKACR